jgi:hypothetical protein
MGARVVLCQPIYGHIPPAAHIAQVEFVLRAGSSGDLIGICTARDTYIDWGRNHIVSLVVERFGDFTHMLWLDGDIIPPVDGLEKLLSHMEEDMGAIGGLYHKKGPPYEPVAYDFRFEEEMNRNVGDWDRTKKLDVSVDALYEVHGLGLGFTLIRREVFSDVSKKTEGQTFQTTLGYGEDVWFFHWATQCGHRVYLDTSVRCRHIGDHEFTTADWEAHRDE